MRPAVSTLVSLLLLASCGGLEPGDETPADPQPIGEIAGQPFLPLSVIFWRTVSEDADSNNHVHLSFSDQADRCAALQGNRGLPSERSLWINLANRGATAFDNPDVVPGTFPIDAAGPMLESHGGRAAIQVNDAACRYVSAESKIANGGSFVLETLDWEAGRATGSFSFSLADGRVFEADFVATRCDPPASTDDWVCE